MGEISHSFFTNNLKINLKCLHYIAVSSTKVGKNHIFQDKFVAINDK